MKIFWNWLIEASLAFALLLLILQAMVQGFDLALFLLFPLLFLFIFWHWYHLRRLRRWLRHGGQSLPKSWGFWGSLFELLRQLQRRQRRQRLRFLGLLRQLRASTQMLPDGIVILNKNKEILWMNTAASSLLQLSPQDRGQKISHFLRYPLFAPFLEQAGEQTLEMPAPGDSWLHLALRCIQDPQQQYLLLLVRDVSQRRLIDQMRKDFVASVSHELRTPLTVLKGYLERLLEADPPYPAAEHEHLDALPANALASLTLMQQQVERMEHIVSDLLLLARLEGQELTATLQTLNMPVLIEEMVSAAEALSGDAGHDFILEVVPTLAVRGVKEELRAAFSNLIFNAVVHTPPGTTITVSWQLSPTGEGIFAVMDDGPGIEAHFIPRLTERFFRVEAARQRHSRNMGTGLGLSIVKHVLDRHQATLHIHSRVGQGSKFFCRFPKSALITVSSAIPDADKDSAKQNVMDNND